MKTVKVRMIFVRHSGEDWWLYHAECDLVRRQDPGRFERKVEHAERLHNLPKGSENVRVVEVDANVEPSR